MPQSIRGDLALKYCRENPDVPTKTLARKMFEETGAFDSIEQARSALRPYRGQSGARLRKAVKHRAQYTQSGDKRRSSRERGILPANVKILIFDIETAPILAYVWRCFKEYISPSQVLTESKVICWSAKWLGEDKVMFDSIQSDMGDGSLKAWVEQDDSRVCATLYDLFNEADIVVAHNGRAFDSATLNARWLKMGFPPPQPYRIFDTLTCVKKVFRFPSNKLEAIARYLGVGRKLDHEGFNLWVKCMGGDRKAWKTMEEYCVMDTLLLEDVYLKIRAWAPQHPNVGLIAGGAVKRCVACGSTAVHEIHKPTHTNMSKFPSWRCESCGKVQRGRKRYKPSQSIEERLSHAL